jgi:hypothetical protein
MKKLFLTGFMFFMFAAVNAQIGDVQQKGSWLYSYDGSKQIGKFSISSSDSFLGFSSSIVVVQKGSWIYSYDANGRQQGKFSVSSGDQFKSVVGNNINIKKGSWLYTYDTGGRQISKRSL